MPERMNTPEFHSEAEEAEWWDTHPDALADALEAAVARGAVTTGTAARKAKTPTTTIRLDPADIARARSQAKSCGLRYQTYLKMLIHSELQKRERSSESGANRVRGRQP